MPTCFDPTSSSPRVLNDFDKSRQFFYFFIFFFSFFLFVLRDDALQDRSV